MNCPECNGKTGVVESRTVELNVYRHRVCKKCGHRFYTEETEIEDITGLKYYWATVRRCSSGTRGSKSNN